MRLTRERHSVQILVSFLEPGVQGLMYQSVITE